MATKGNEGTVQLNVPPFGAIVVPVGIGIGH
jgi:hypothetical protein